MKSKFLYQDVDVVSLAAISIHHITDIINTSEIFPTYIKIIIRAALQIFFSDLDVKMQPQLFKNVFNELCL